MVASLKNASALWNSIVLVWTWSFRAFWFGIWFSYFKGNYWFSSYRTIVQQLSGLRSICLQNGKWWCKDNRVDLFLRPRPVVNSNYISIKTELILGQILILHLLPSFRFQNIIENYTNFSPSVTWQRYCGHNRCQPWFACSCLLQEILRHKFDIIFRMS